MVAIRRIIIKPNAAYAWSGINSTERPRIKKILNTFDPMIFSIIISDSFWEDVIFGIVLGMFVMALSLLML